MKTTLKEIQGWLERAIERKATHLIVACDTFDHEDYPVFVSKNENVRDIYNQRHNINMQRVVEVYDLSKNIQTQLMEVRSMNF